MKQLLFLLALLITFSSMSQILTTTLENNTDRVLNMQEYPKDSAIWYFKGKVVQWKYYDASKKLMRSTNYTILQAANIVNANSTYYIVKDTKNNILKIQLWVLDDGSKCVTHGFSTSYTNYFGNVNYIVSD